MKIIGQILKTSLFLLLFLCFSAVSYAEYTKTFTISAYYSPLPCQERYATGSYETDIRLNGRGTNGADGTPVYAGMIAAPKSYSFGTKMYIPGIGMTTVHDRGGAIVEAENYAGYYDRLDVWMGYGDKGLKRALAWGKRDITVTVYGVDSSILDAVTIEGYSPDEKYYSCDDNSAITGIPSESALDSYVEPDFTSSNYIASTDEVVVEDHSYDSDLFYHPLAKGDSGYGVYKLKKELKKLNFYKADLSYDYDDLTAHAVFKFQQSQGIVVNELDAGAGFLGPSTRSRLNEIVTSRKNAQSRIADVNDNVIETDGVLIASELDPGDTSSEVMELQEFLIAQGLYKGSFTSNYFGEITQASLIDFQIQYGIISSPEDLGAGRVGPSTLALINSMA